MSKNTIDKIDLSNIDKSSSLYELIEKLNCKTEYGGKDPTKSIMHHNQLCNHDDGFLCEHRLEYIINFIKEKL